MKANLIAVKVVPRDFKSIPGILPNQKVIEGEPVELELTKDEICRCMNYADVFDMSSGEEVLIDELSFKEIVEYVEDEEASDEPVEEENGTDEPKDEPTVDPVYPGGTIESPEVEEGEF